MTMMNYLIQEGNAINPMQFITEIAKKSEKHEEALMTMAQQIEEIGMQKGKLEGIKEGMQEGEKKASQDIGVSFWKVAWRDNL
nr:hypothetical protein [Candidatus Hamiltonella defensa]